LRPPVDKHLILVSLAAIARNAGRSPSRSEFISLSGISEHQVSQFFPTWNDAVRAAGLIPHTINMRLTDHQLFEDWVFVVRRQGKIPTRRAYHLLGQYDHRTFERRFGPWSQLPEVFRKFAQGKPEWADVLALLPPLKSKPSPAPSLPVRLSPSPKHSAPNFAPNPTPNPVPSPALHLASYSASQTDTAPDPHSLSAPQPAKLRFLPLRDRPTYGQPMDFRGLRHEPVNEQGVVLLFGMVARDLGYIVEAVQSGFPDCEAKRQIAPHRWQRVHLEFEFESRNFRDHGHPLTGCDVIVCWRHNWPDHPQHLEILELSSRLPSLRNSTA
jgi:hypothetical protein